MSKMSVVKGFKHIQYQVGECVDAAELLSAASIHTNGLAISVDYLQAAELEKLTLGLEQILRENVKLKSLSLRDCGLAEHNIIRLLKALSANPCSSLTNLDLAGNYLYDHSAHVLIDMLTYHHQLTQICLDNNYISDLQLHLIDELLEHNGNVNLNQSGRVVVCA